MTGRGLGVCLSTCAGSKCAAAESADAQHWVRIANEKQQEVEELRSQLSAAYHQGLREGREEAERDLVDGALSQGALTEEQEKQVRGVRRQR